MRLLNKILFCSHILPTLSIPVTSKTSQNHDITPNKILDILNGLTNTQINTIYNVNSDPVIPIYPKKKSTDTSYTLSEDELRSAIHIPLEFQHCKGKQPILLVPGTADPAGSTFYFSYAKLLSNTSFADPVWVNIPNTSLSDTQLSSEYVAYAINYISDTCISSPTKNDATSIGMLSFSQGGINVQWALKYWPSTRDTVSDFMAISADFHGSKLEGICSGLNDTCTPAIRQQGYESDFIHALRKDGGDSAYVSTTSVYSGVDEVVQPQSGENASAALNDVRDVGVSNTQVQIACPGKRAGGFYTHESMLVNPVAYALFVDALTHDGPGNLSRIDLKTVCDQVVPPGLGKEDLFGTEAMAIGYGLVDTLSYDDKGDGKEPSLMDYVQV
ncbi:uncharacterized protein N7483_012154 [Penicillium malachiteum]|uniref:uncharacterized protein n=1 Tax=Penicillium malachiteum TaxID=1324776 RepID=UPI002548A2B1|nr:uncharacterized protein N7483_012154 [Penicillium malachiteum]KAJ5714973.1 hypothetical protein N7483_012154 [Penicillium malachiteum]